MTKSSKKKKKNFVIMSLLLIFLSISLVIVTFAFKEDEAGEEETETINALKIDSNGIEGLHFETANLDAAFSKKDKVWKYDQDEDFPADSTLISSMIVKASNIVATRKITDISDNLNDYGMNDPILSITLTSSDSVDTQITVGSQNKISSEYYLRINAEDIIYTIDSALVSAYSADLYDLAELETIPTLSGDTISSINIQNGSNLFEIINDGEYGKDMQGASTWYLKSPFEYLRGIESYKFDDYLTILENFAYYKLAAYNITEDDLKAYGLYDSQRYIDIIYGSSDNEKKLRLSIGNVDESESYYYVYLVQYEGLSISQSKRIYLMTSDTVASIINFNPMDYMFKQVIYTKLDDLDTAKIIINKKTYNINVKEIKDESSTEEATAEEETTDNTTSIQHSNKTLEFYVNDKKVDETKFRDFYKEFIAISCENIIFDKEDEVDGEAYMTVELIRNSEPFKKITAEYISHDVGYYQVKVNGATDFLVNKTVIGKIAETLEELVTE